MTASSTIRLNAIRSKWMRARVRLIENRPYLQGLFLLILLAWLVWQWRQTIEAILHVYSPMPYWDYWRVVDDMLRYKSFGISTFLRQHNDHRIIFPELVCVLDMLVWHGRQILPLAVSFLCYFGTYLLLAGTIFFDRHLSAAVRCTAVLVAGIIVGWDGSIGVLGNAFQLTWTLLEFATVLAFVCMAKLSSTGRQRYLTGAIVSAFVATYSLANGMLVWPLLVGAGLLLKMGARKIWPIAVAGGVSIGVYFIGYHRGSSNLTNLIRHPFYALGFVGSYLSMPFGGVDLPRFGAYVGLASLLIVIILAIITSRAGLITSREGVVLFGCYLFTVLSAILAATGRMHPEDPFFRDAKAYRYIASPLINWAVFALICIWVSSRLRWRIVSPFAIAALCALLAGIGFSKVKFWLEPLFDGFAEQQLASLSVVDGLRDPMLLSQLYPSPDFIYPLLDYLRENHLSVFASHRYNFLDKPSSAFSPKLPETAFGEVSYVFPVLGGLEVVGWADTSIRHWQPEWILLTNDKGEIAGFARKLPAGFPITLRRPTNAYSLGWAGFVNFQVKSESYSAYLVTKAGLQSLGAFSMPPIASVERAVLGPALPAISWRPDPNWSVDGTPPGVASTTRPAGRIFGSWSGSDSNTGQIVSLPFATPANGCMILPVLHGPYVQGQSVEVLDADGGGVLTRVPMQDWDLEWKLWRISIPAGVQRVQIVARDQGSGWGQWVAIGDVAACR